MATQKKRGLGKGLGALISGSDITQADQLKEAKQNLGNKPQSKEQSKQQNASKNQGFGIQQNDFVTQNFNENSNGSSPADLFFGQSQVQTKTQNQTKNQIQNSAEPNSSVQKLAEFDFLDVNIIVPNKNQPRKEFEKTALQELSNSIKEVGLLQPIIVRPIREAKTGLNSKTSSKVKPKYELIMGERRLRAIKLAGLKQVPAIIRKTEDSNMLRDALLENLHRVSLSPLEEAASYRQMMDDFGSTHSEIAQSVSKSRAYITNIIRLLKLPVQVQKLLISNEISTGHARALLALQDESAINYLANQIIENGLSVRRVESLVALQGLRQIQEQVEQKNGQVISTKNGSQALGGSKTKIKKGSKGQNLLEMEGVLADALDTVVKINLGLKKGSIVVDFASISDLERIIKKIIN